MSGYTYNGIKGEEEKADLKIDRLKKADVEDKILNISMDSQFKDLI